MREKRGHMRVPLSIPVLCEPADGEAFGGMTADLGVDGSCIESATVPTFGTELCVIVRLPGSPDLSRLPAIVRWTKAGSFGVQFRSLGARDTKRITELLAASIRSRRPTT
jgi:hypothetical protein